MQQRYYDPTIGRFLSVDPVTADGNTGGNFNRYWYANNNPYTFTDPDGRLAWFIPLAIRCAASAACRTAVVGAGAYLTYKATQALEKAAPAIDRMYNEIVEDSSESEGSASGEKPSLLDSKGEKHVLDGDSTGGGHRSGTGNPGKSEFPSDWSDDKIKGEISDVATDPATKWSNPDARGYVTGTGTRDGVDIKVVNDTKNGRIVTGYPTNLPRNPKKDEQ